MPVQIVTTNDPSKGIIKAGKFKPETGVFLKTITKANQRFHQYKGYAIQADVMEELKKRDAKIIRMHVKYGKFDYTLSASMAIWDAFGKKVSFGHGEQIVLAEDKMEKKEHDTKQTD